MNIRGLRAEIIKFLEESGSDSASADAGLIIMSILKIDKTRLLTGDMSVSDEDSEIIRTLAERCAEGEPVQYIIGKCEFMSLPFMVKAGVLIPRADTEILVEAVIQRLDKRKSLSVFDVCCGSGCIGISLAYYLPNISVTAIDISESALKLACDNAENNGVSGRIHFEKADVMKERLSAGADCIVSNPPYIKTKVIKELDYKVRCFEPGIALDGGENGLVFYERITKSAILKEGGLLAFEIGYDQGEAVFEILKKNGYADIEVITDLEGRDRVVLGIATKSRTTSVS